MKKNPFEQFNVEKEPKEIQKSEIFGALKQYNNPVIFKKKGKEIKEHIENVVLPKLLEKKSEIQVFLDEFLSNVVVMPTRPCWMRITMSDEEFPYKQYGWEETNYQEKAFGTIFKGFGDIEEAEMGECEGCCKSPYYPQNKEEAESRLKYNSFVENFRDIIMDIKTANVLIKNLKDDDEYFLNLDQLTALNWE